MSDVITTTFTIQGLDELQRVLEDLPKKVANKVLREDLRDAATYLVQEMIMRAPYKTGFLAEHFDDRVRINSGEVAGTAFVGPQGRMYYPGGDRFLGIATGRHPHRGGLVPTISVARFLEFGTSKMPPHTFMSTAFESSKDALLIKIIQGIRDALVRWLS